MKKIPAIILVLVMSLVFFAGCEDNLPPDSTAKKPNSAAESKETRDKAPDSGVQNIPDSGAQNIPDSSAQKPPAVRSETPQNLQPPVQNNQPSADKIGIDAAKNIALKRAGLSANDVVFVKAELDFDDGLWKYEIEFRQGRYEYDVDVKADDGKILSFEKDIDD